VVEKIPFRRGRGEKDQGGGWGEQGCDDFRRGTTFNSSHDHLEQKWDDGD